jgi:DNA-binding NarL/FixJ family response regulator
MIRGQAGAHTVRITSKKGAIMTAYVIDNHPIMSDQIAMVIRRIKPGLKVVSVRTIDDLNCAVISGGPPEIICTDLELPVSFGISGIKTLRKKFPNTRLAVITGSDPKPYETECLNAGADVFIPKTDPVSLVLEGGFKFELQHGLTRRETPHGAS